jgi:hypothetical protein
MNVLAPATLLTTLSCRRLLLTLFAAFYCNMVQDPGCSCAHAFKIPVAAAHMHAHMLLIWTIMFFMSTLSEYTVMMGHTGNCKFVNLAAVLEQWTALVCIHARVRGL